MENSMTATKKKNQDNVISINGKDYNSKELSTEQIKQLQAKSRAIKIDLDQTNVALNAFTSTLVASLEKEDTTKDK
jgi:PDZ domain-containing secreted protein